MKRLVLLVLAVGLLAQTTVFAQEREPLVMRIELEWTLAGTVLGVLAGTALWLTDPGNPNLSLARQAIEGAALGTIAGAGFGLYMIQRNAQFPNQTAMEAPPALWGTGADPVAVRERRELAIMGGAPPNQPTIVFSTIRMHF